MQVKHTVLLVLVFVSSLIWVGILFADCAQPPAGANGLFGDNQYCNSCHTGGFTSTTMVSGLPAAWVPDTDYHLTITVPTASGAKYGFELSAIYSSNSTQAGTLSIDPGGAPATTIPGSGPTAGLTFAVHDVSNSNNVYKVLWHSPLTPGGVRIDVGAVRANADGTRFNDTVFADSRILPANVDVTPPTVTIAAPTPLPTFSTNATHITMSGTASDNVGVTHVTWTNDRGGNATCTGTTNWTCSIIDLQPGANVVTVRAFDAAGNIGMASPTVILDTTPPMVTITSPTSNPTFDTGTSSITLAGNASDDGGVTSVTMTSNQGGIGACSGTTTWTCTNILLMTGATVLTIRAFDVARNAGTDTLTVTLLPPTAGGLSPSSGAQGSNVNVQLTGTGFVAGMTVNAGSGITVSNISILSEVSAAATFGIASNASLGTRNVTVAIPGRASEAVTFTVTPGPPSLSGLCPSTGDQGSSVNVRLTGTGFVGGMTVSAGSGITVSNVIPGSVSVLATFAIASNASLGARNVTVTTVGGTSEAAAFTVGPAPPTLCGVTPAIGGPGSSVNVALDGGGFVDGMTVNAGAGITISNLNVLSATSATATFAIDASAAVGTRGITVTVSGQASNAFTFNVVTAFPDLAITSTHASNFGVGFKEPYTIRVNNVGASSTTGTIAVTDNLTLGLDATSASGTGWSCSIDRRYSGFTGYLPIVTVHCTSATALGPAASSAPITLEVVAFSPYSFIVTHRPTVSTPGDLNSSNDSAADVTSVVATPKPSFVFSPSTLVAGEQATVGLTLASPFPHDVTGTLTMSFSSNAAIPADDPAIQFGSGGRQAAFTIAANALQARFNANAEEGPVGFQTGTVAGTIGFTGALQAGTLQTTFSPPSSVLEGLTIPLAAPSIQSVQTNTQSGFAAVISLMSTMREVTQLSLTFNTTPAVRLSCGSVTGCSVSGSTMTFDVKALFDSWFNGTSSFGSLSSLRVPLSVQGSIHGTVSATLRNTQGISNSVPFSLP